MVQFNSDMAEKLGTKIIRDLVSRGCTRWAIHKELGVSYNAVTDMMIGKYCDDRHIPRLQQFRYKFYLDKGLNPFGDK